MKLFGRLFSMILVFAALLGNGQQPYKLDISKSSLKITGTSTVHDWTMIAGQYDCTVDVQLNENKDLKISNLQFLCKTASITSEHSLMNDKTHEALKAKQFNEITFGTSNDQSVVVNGGTIKGLLRGNLQIAGQNIPSNLPFNGVIDTDGHVRVKGDVKIKMSTYKIKPPTAMMGTIKTGDEVNIKYDFYFKLLQ
jgi:polyisoprenoid-binding protein YceI